MLLGRLLVAGALLAVGAHASFCGESMVPYSFEVLEGGQPVLGCARPSCFGWAPSGRPHSQQATFYRIRGSADGRVRVEDPESIPPFVQGDLRFRSEQAAHCEPGFGSASCASANSWVGGIAPLLNVSSYPTTLRCCVYAPLQQSEDRGVASVGAGQIVVGGEVLSEGTQYAFDYISDVAKTVNFDRSIKYDVAIRRFACAPLPGLTNIPEKKVKNQQTDVRFAPPRAYQDPLQRVDQPIAPPRVQRQHGGSHGHSHGGSHGHSHGSHGSHGSHSHGSHGSHSHEHVHRESVEQNGVIEEIVREEGVQLPPGTRFNQEPILPPQPAPAQPPVVQTQFFPPPQYPPVVAQAGAGAGYFPVAAQSGGGFWLCFSADSTVQMVDGSEKRMDQLEKNDFVMSLTPAGITHVPVNFWLHRNPETVAEFHRFETEDGRTIKLTGQHYIYKGDCANVGNTLAPAAVARSAVYAEQVSVGDCLYTVDGERIREVRVIKADKVVETGIYAPMTANGKIVVGGVYASCHTSIQSHTIQKTYFSMMNGLRTAWASVFGESEETFVDTPYGLDLIKSVFDLVAPKGLATF